MMIGRTDESHFIDDPRIDACSGDFGPAFDEDGLYVTFNQVRPPRPL